MCFRLLRPAAMLESEPNIDSVIIESNQGELYYTSNLTNVTLQSLSIYPKADIDAVKGGAVWVDTFRPSFLLEAWIPKWPYPDSHQVISNFSPNFRHEKCTPKCPLVYPRVFLMSILRGAV